MARDYKKDYERRKLRAMWINVTIPREIGWKLKIKLAKDRKKLTDFVKEAVDEYLKK